MISHLPQRPENIIDLRVSRSLFAGFSGRARFCGARRVEWGLFGVQKSAKVGDTSDILLTLK